jgi:hypothetical protein
VAASDKRRFKIFVSFSVSETEIANVVREALQMLLGDSVDIFISTGLEHPSSHWIEEIREEVERADIFLLLVSVGATSYSYSGFELGMFNASMRESRSEKRALALCSPSVAVPAILAEVQNVRALQKK